MNKKIFIILLTTLFLFVSVVQAQTSELPNPRILPDSPFYFLKSWTESIGTFFTFGTESRVKRFLNLSEKRLAEAIILNERGKIELAEKTLQEYQDNFELALGDIEEKAHSENFIASLLDPLVGYAVRGFNRLESASIQNEKAIQKHQDNLERLIVLDIEIKERVDVKLPDRREKRPEIISEEPEELDSLTEQELEKARIETEKARAEAERLKREPEEDTKKEAEKREAEELAKKETEQHAETETLEVLAKCLNDKGVKLYGTPTCPYCLMQIEMFGQAGEYLPYVNCSEKMAECKEANVRGVPDWRFPDGNQQLGMLPVEELAKLSGCGLE